MQIIHKVMIERQGGSVGHRDTVGGERIMTRYILWCVVYQQHHAIKPYVTCSSTGALSRSRRRREETKRS